MLLLFGLIWSFHLQYDQPAAFYLKAPTFLYAFIFIALRVFSFEVGLVVLAGAAAAIGWLVLVVYAVAESQAGDIITRDYIAYMTSSRSPPGGGVRQGYLVTPGHRGALSGDRSRPPPTHPISLRGCRRGGSVALLRA